MLLELLLSPSTFLVCVPVLVAAYYAIPYFRDPLDLRRFPSVFPSALTDFWLLYQARRGRRFLAVHEAHQQLGRFVRLQTNHVSIADVDAIPVVYGHGTGFLKSDYYKAFVSIQPGLFNTRDRVEHTRKRKTISHTFSTKSIAQFEQYIHANLQELLKQWNALAASPDNGEYRNIDALNWFNYLAFDMIGDLAFGAPFGMLSTGRDIAAVEKSPGEVTYAPAIQVLNRRGEVSATLGCIPSLKPYAKYLPDSFFRDGIKAVEDLTGIAISRVNERLARPSNDRVDILQRLMEGRDEKGEKLGREELTVEALTQLIAGSDTTSNTSCAILYYVLKNPSVLAKLQAELDNAIPKDTLPYFSDIKDLPYLRATINETMRIHSTSSLGLPRVVPPQGATVCNHYFKPSTVLSVPSYTIHHSTTIWGDPENFRPERWLVDDKEELARLKEAFIPFSYGPRACVGRNVAEMELVLIVAVVFRGFEFLLRQEGLQTVEGFLRKPVALEVGLRKRRV